MRRISEFLEIDTPESLLPDLVEAASFESMKANGDAMLPTLKLAFDRAPTGSSTRAAADAGANTPGPMTWRGTTRS